MKNNKSTGTRILSIFFLLIKFYSRMKSECKEDMANNGNGKSGFEAEGIRPFAGINNFVSPNPPTTLTWPLHQQQQQTFYPFAYTRTTATSYHQPSAVEANNYYYPYVNVANVNSQQYVAGAGGQVSNQQQQQQQQQQRQSPSRNPEYPYYNNVIAEPAESAAPETSWTPQLENVLPPVAASPANNLQNEPSQHFLIAANNRNPFPYTEAIFGNTHTKNTKKEEEEENDVCSAVTCKGNSVCVARLLVPHCVAGNGVGVSCLPTPREAVCVNRCETVRCSKGHVCKTSVGPCGNSFCEPSAICWNPCEDVVCNGKSIISGGINCTSLTLPYCWSSSSSYCGTAAAVPICGKDPCETKICPRGRGCYPQIESCALNGPCEVKAVCRDPCFSVQCGVGEYCRIDERPHCVKAPCNPIPVCVNPCDSVHCPQGQHCRVLQQAECTAAAAAAAAAATPPCYPMGVCEADHVEE